MLIAWLGCCLLLVVGFIVFGVAAHQVCLFVLLLGGMWVVFVV